MMSRDGCALGVSLLHYTDLNVKLPTDGTVSSQNNCASMYIYTRAYKSIHNNGCKLKGNFSQATEFGESYYSMGEYGCYSSH